MTTTLASHVHAIFDAFARNSAAADGQQTITIAQCWRKTVLDSETDTTQLFERLALVQAAIQRLRKQIESSRSLEEHARIVARSITSSFDSLLQPDVFQRQVGDFKGQLSDERLSTLLMLAQMMRQEFPDASLNAEEVAGLKTDIDALISAISKSTIDADLRALLMRHATFMAWAIRNMNFVNFADMYDAVGKMMMMAYRMPDAPEGEKHAGDGLRAALIRTGSRIGTVLSNAEKADKSMSALGHIVHQGGAALQFLSGLIT